MTTLGACIALMAIVVVVLVCLDANDDRPKPAPGNYQPNQHPAERAPAVRCPACGTAVRYHHHPQGRQDALNLHTAYECAAAPAHRETA